MRRLFFYPALITAILFSSTACSDDDKGKLPNTDPKSTKEYFTANLEDMRQEFTVDMSEAPLTIKGKGGIKITIEPGTFTVNGTAVDGEVDIVLYEMLSLSSIAMSGTNTNYVGTRGEGYLRTDGFFYIDAYAGGKNVDQSLSQNLWVSVPNKLNDNGYTEIWQGTETAGENGDQFAWDDPDDKDQGRGVEGMEDFEFDLGKLGWCNCDLYAYGQHTLTVTLTGTFGKFANFMAQDGATYVLFCEKGGTILAQLYNVVDESTVQSYLNSMPDNITGRLFAFSIMNGVYTYAEKEITITADVTETLDMQITTKEYIDSRLKSLDGYK